MKGQEISVVLTSTTQGPEPGVAGVIKSCEFQDDIEILSEGYLGALTEQKDMIFTGVSGNMEMNLRSADAYSLMDRIKLVAQRRIPGEQFNIVITYRFPTGGARRVVISNVQFGNPNVSAPSRKDYVVFKFDFAADDLQILPAVA
jgi:hypothetical protein